MKAGNMRLSTQLRLGLGAVLVITCVLSAIAWLSMQRAWQKTETLYQHPFQTERAVNTARLSVWAMRVNMRDFLLLEKNADRQAVLADMAANQADVIKYLDVLYKTYLGPRSDIDAVRSEFQEWVSIREGTLRLLKAGKLSEARRRHVPGGLAPKQALKMLAAMRKISGFAGARADQLYREARELQAELLLRLALFFAAILLMSAWASYQMHRAIIMPLREMNQELERRQAETRGLIGELEAEIRVRKKVQEEERRIAGLLLQEKERLKMAQTAARAGLWDWDLASGKLEWTSELFQLLGREESAGATFEAWLSSIHPDDRERALAVTKRAAEAGTALSNEYRLALAGGEQRWIAVVGDVLHDPAGKPCRMSGICIDITERKKAEEAVRASEERFRQLFETMSEGFATHELICDRQGRPADYRFLDVNPAFENLTGLKRADIIGKTVLQVLPGTERSWIENYGRVALTGERLHMENFSGALGRQYEVNAFRISPGRFAVSFMDVTERKRAEAEIRALNAGLEQKVRARTAELTAVNQELNEFTSSVAHDLRAPLRHVAGFAKLLEEAAGAGLGKEARHYLDVIGAGTGRMGELIDHLLGFARMSRGALTPVKTDLGALVRETVQQLSGTAGRDIEWVIGALPAVTGDAGLLRQVLVNLLENAVKYTAKKDTARIEVSARSEGGETIVAVRDNGAGFDMKYVEKLFKVFQRLHSEEEFQGVGIGLANVKRIITRHGGRVWAEGAEGGGAVFYFSLPEQGQAEVQPVESQGGTEK
ncbi:MAG TPA: PAS domain S-box protein [Elusimicrobiales bacterium]|nr:PAS domain S-box protein [Elusimicrobiales bacterium]